MRDVVAPGTVAKPTPASEWGRQMVRGPAPHERTRARNSHGPLESFHVRYECGIATVVAETGRDAGPKQTGLDRAPLGPFMAS